MDFEVNRHDFRQTRVVDRPAAELQPGQIRLAVDRFAVTTNNITYAVAGDLLDYWGFFPTEEPWGRIPVMGFGSVAESAHPKIATGGRYFGFYPMSSEVVIDADGQGGGFRDVGPHRANHAATYTGFRAVDDDVMFRADKADEYLLLWGMFMTSFLVDDHLADADVASDIDGTPFRGATQTLVTSASSKTSICLAHCLARREGQRAIGLTSERNRAFVEGLGLYDRVVTYDEIEQLPDDEPSCLVDMAGSGPVRSAVHNRFAGNLRASLTVGATHWEDQGGGEDLPGPRPEFFFAPAQSAKRSKDWGPDELAKRIAASFHALLDDTSRWLTVEHHRGAEGLETVYRRLLEGQADPSVGYIVSPASELPS